MPIDRILINVEDVRRSVDFYAHYLDAVVVGEVFDSGATVDVVTAVLEFSHLAVPQASTWSPDDLSTGFRHIGFKVADLDSRVAVLKADGVRFHLDPLDAEGGVRIAFFFDPDGTLLEFVQGDLQYPTIIDPVAVAAERALAIPTRPRFDHIAITVEDFAESEQFYRAMGFGNVGTIPQPSDPRGFRMDYFRGGDTVFEVFTYRSEKRKRAPQSNALGFVAAQLAGEITVPVGSDPVGRTSRGDAVFADPDGFCFTVGE